MSFIQVQKMIMKTKNEDNLPTIRSVITLVPHSEVTSSNWPQEENTQGESRQEMGVQDLHELKRSDPFLYFSDDARRIGYITRGNAIVQDTSPYQIVERKTRISFEVHNSGMLSDLFDLEDMEGLEEGRIDILDYLLSGSGGFQLDEEDAAPAQ